VSLEKESFEVRKFLIGALVAGSMAVTGALAMPAHATSNCTTGVTPDAGGGGGSACIATPAGAFTAAGSATTQSGYAVADGASTNPGPASGYIGIDNSDGGATVVGCSNGDYTPGAGTQYDADTTQGNHVIGSQAHPPSAPDPADPCTPAAP
jgi:hypothetical protein